MDFRQTAFRRAARAVALIATVTGFAHGALSPDQKERLLRDLEATAVSANAESGGALIEHLRDLSVSMDDWRDVFDAYFEAGVFTPGHAQFWDHAVASVSRDLRDRAALISGWWSCAGLRRGIEFSGSRPGSTESAMQAAVFLQRVAMSLSATGRTELWNGLLEAFKKTPAAALSIDRARYGLHVQLALSLRDLAGDTPQRRAQIADVLGIRDAARLFWETHAVFLFDGGGLAPVQVAALSEVLNAVPRNVHATVAFIVPETTGLSASAGWHTSGQVVGISPVPMAMMSDPREFISTVGQPVAPVFALNAAQQLVRAAQQIQFAVRPDLRARRDLLLYRAGRKREHYLRRYQFVHPDVYLADPDTLLPSVAYLYFLDSRRAFEMGLYLFGAGAEEATDSFLLLADLLSGGGNTTWIYATAPDGSMAKWPTPIGRVLVPSVRVEPGRADIYVGTVTTVNLVMCNAIAINGFTYEFGIDPQGVSTRVLRR